MFYQCRWKTCSIHVHFPALVWRQTLGPPFRRETSGPFRYVCVCVYVRGVCVCVCTCLCVYARVHICVTKDSRIWWVGRGGAPWPGHDGRKKESRGEVPRFPFCITMRNIYNNRIKRFNSVLPFFTQNNQTAAALFGLFKFWRYLTDPDHWRFAYYRIPIRVQSTYI